MTILGLEVFGSTWFIVSAVIFVISLILIGFFKTKNTTLDEIFVGIVISAFVSWLWPLMILIGVIILVIAGLITFGIKLSSFLNKKAEKESIEDSFLNRLSKYKPKQK